MRVDEDGGDEDGVHERVEGTADEGSNSERDEGGGHETLECPVVAAVGRV